MASGKSSPCQLGSSLHLLGIDEHSKIFDMHLFQVTLLAWHQLRQQHLVALVEKIENQGVLVMVTFLHPSATCALSIIQKYLACRLWRTGGALRLVYWSLAWVCSFTGWCAAYSCLSGYSLPIFLQFAHHIIAQGCVHDKICRLVMDKSLILLAPFRIGHCKGFALLTYLLLNVAAMLWQVPCIM